MIHNNSKTYILSMSKVFKCSSGVFRGGGEAQARGSGTSLRLKNEYN